MVCQRSYWTYLSCKNPNEWSHQWCCN